MQKGEPLQTFLNTNVPAELGEVISALANACSEIAKQVNNAALRDITGAANMVNVQGEEVQKLDELSNEIIMRELQQAADCAGYVSEENESARTFNSNGKYVVASDPLDGSSNIDVAAPIGTIFAIHQRLSAAGDVNDADFLQAGNRLKAAGFAVYGSSTILILTTGSGVNGFTLSTSDYKFYLSHPQINIPAKGKIYSLNQGNAGKYEEGLLNFIAWCSAADKATNRPYSLRYIGSMVGDLFRTLLKGGIFVYPANKGEAKGKLRLLYECQPMSMIVEQAGGKASNGSNDISALEPTEIHERSAIYIGSRENVEACLQFVNQQKQST